jgi:hypothetical protein
MSLTLNNFTVNFMVFIPCINLQCAFCRYCIIHLMLTHRSKRCNRRSMWHAQNFQADTKLKSENITETPLLLVLMTCYLLVHVGFSWFRTGPLVTLLCRRPRNIEFCEERDVP